MLDKIVKETTDAVVTAIQGAVKAANQVGSEAGSAVKKALLAAAPLPRDVVEKAIKGSSK